ncbi:RNA polymerase sigma-70 factor [Olivibacter domesticus]|uniref:RNA polymerase sigma-70 factor, ECF subfamily n=1 Tax=Olivibacter domesticus TaxID=407022 RepID=A0A1H7XXF7_OLID1|nr:RNA polymerase sigma-70 factor [Olivibacter domesticus]SEM38500.1 RNA polymerase sigma-70 factor, ECF subfamily [Olivibacter domesticus]
MTPIYKNLSDKELIDLLKCNNNQAFTEIYDRYWKKLLTVAHNKLDRFEDAEEIVQDIFVNLWNRRKDIEINVSLNNYLAVSVKYRVIKTLDKYFNRQHYVNTLVASNYVDDSTQEWLQFNELFDQLNHYVADLPEKCQLVFKLSRELGYSQKQIAAKLQISEKTVEAHIGKAIKTLRTKLSHFIFTLL